MCRVGPLSGDHSACPHSTVGAPMGLETQGPCSRIWEWCRLQAAEPQCSHNRLPSAAGEPALPSLHRGSEPPLLKICNCYSVTSATFCNIMPALPSRGREVGIIPPSRRVGQHVHTGMEELQVTISADNLPQTPELETTTTQRKSRERKEKMIQIKCLYLPIHSIFCP